MKRFVLIGGVVVLMASVLFFGFQRSTPFAEVPLVAVKISDRGLASALPLYVAIEKGMFAKHGIEPELVKLIAGNDVFNALTAGNIDIGELPIDPILLAESKSETGVKIVLAGKWSKETNKNFDALFVSASSTIQHINELAGKKIGVFPGITAKTVVKEYLTQRNIDTSKIEFIPLPPNAQLPAIGAGSIDALLAFEPTATVAKQSGLKKIDESLFNNIGINYYAVYAASKSFSEHDAAKEVADALVEAAEYMADHEEESRTILGKYTALRKLASDMAYFPQYHVPTADDITNISALSAFYTKNGMIEKSVTADHLIAVK